MTKENYIEKGGYIEAIGRRKTSVARVRVSKTAKGFLVNNKTAENYFPTQALLKKAMQPLRENDEMYKELGVTVVVKGGGVASHSEAVRHGLTRALVSYNKDDQKHFKDLGFLTRDSRKKERKKFGLRKARRAPQWSKR